MKKSNLVGWLVITLMIGILAGCGNVESTDTESERGSFEDSEVEKDSSVEQDSNTENNTVVTTEIETGSQGQEDTSQNTDTEEPTETQHSHSYAENITTKVSCETDGIKTFVCECGDSYTETIPANGHSFGEYVYNNDATISADGTETASCACGEKKTRTVKGTKLTYTYTEMNKTMYAKSSVNVRSVPSTDGKKLGKLNEAQAVMVTGQCNETGWYRIIYNDSVGYVSSSYLLKEKPDSQSYNIFTDTKAATKEELSAYTFTEMNTTLYTSGMKTIWTLPNDDWEYLFDSSNQMGWIGKFVPVKITGKCNEADWYRVEIGGITGYVSNEPSGVGDTAFLEALPKNDKVDLGYEVGSAKWHEYWDGSTYGEYYYATGKTLNLNVSEVHYFGDYPNDYVIGSYAKISVTVFGTVEVQGEY